MRLFVTVLLASALSVASVGATVQPAAAGWEDGWFSFPGSTSSKSRTFYERSPGATTVVLAIQKKAGRERCRAQVIVKKGGYVWKSRYIYKYTRTQARGYYGTISWPNRVTRTTVTVKTNGHCIYKVGAR